MGAYPKPVIKAFTAGADLSALQYSWVKYGTENDTVVGCSADNNPVGILMNAPESGEVAEVAIAGGAKLKSSGTIGANASIGVAASGQAKAVTSGDASAIALEDAVANDVIPVLIDRHTGKAV